jgi:hypothetical protein
MQLTYSEYAEGSSLNLIYENGNDSKVVKMIIFRGRPTWPVTQRDQTQASDDIAHNL